VPICRAAFGALAKRSGRAFYPDMEQHPPPGGQTSHPRFPRRIREIALAVLLTIAAAGFIAAALLRGDGGSPRTPGVETARKPSVN
jgi:hypothetical protein